MAKKSNKSCERKQQAAPSKVSEIKSVDKCIQELDLTREELSFLLFQAARSLRINPVPDENGEYDPEGLFILSFGAYALSWMITYSCDAETAMCNGLKVMSMDIEDDDSITK